MYEERFGLKTNPFRLNAEGSAVFTGPQQATIISSLHKALAGTDNVVVVSGPAGVGKTAIVNRALETNKAHQMAATIGRMRLGPDEILELLLAGFGVSRQPNSTMQRFAAFQRIVAEKTAAGIRIVIVVEDAVRLGDDALLELEALTANSAGVGGANVILMGPPEIHEHLARPEMARLKQRTRKAQKIAPFSQAEVQGYLAHVVRLAGGELSSLFEEDAAAMAYRCSEGIPRVVNNICDAALNAALEGEQSTISADLIRQVAYDMYGLEPSMEDTPDVAAEEEAEVEAAAEPDPAPEIDIPQVAVAEEPVAEFNEEPSAEEEAPEEEPEPVLDVMAEPEQVDPVEDESDLPPIVAAALAQEHDESVTEPTNEFPKVTLADMSDDDNMLIADTGMNVQPQMADEDSDEVVEDDEEDFDDNMLIADTGMNLQPRVAGEETAEEEEPEAEVEAEAEIPPEFEPDPDMEIAASQLAGNDDDSGNEDSAEDDLPTLSSSMAIDIEKEVSAAEQENTEEQDEAKPSPAEIRAKRSTEDIKKSLDAAMASFEVEPTAIIEKPNIEGMAGLDIDSTSSIRKPDFNETVDESDAVQAGAEIIEDKPVTASQKPVPDLDALEAAISAARRSEPADDVAAENPVDLSLDEPPVPELEPETLPGPEPVATAEPEEEGELVLEPEVEAQPEMVLEPVTEDEPELIFDTEEEPQEEVAVEAVDETDIDGEVEEQEAADDIPALTLDQSLEDQRNEGAKLDEMAEELANANSLEDISDVMAETLFGQEFEQIAAEALANPPAAGTLPGEEPDDVVAQPALADSPSGPSANDSLAGESNSEVLESELSEVSVPEPEPKPLPPDAVKPAPEVAKAPAANSIDVPMPAASDKSNPESIEDQIETSITQTLKAINPDDFIDQDDDEDDEPKGFFGRLKKSLKG